MLDIPVDTGVAALTAIDEARREMVSVKMTARKSLELFFLICIFCSSDLKIMFHSKIIISQNVYFIH